MAQPFYFGPYLSITTGGLGPGESEEWTFGPFGWQDSAVTVTAHPLGGHVIGDRQLTVTDLRIQNRATGEGEAQFVHCTVRNTGRDSTNVSVIVAGIKP